VPYLTAVVGKRALRTSGIEDGRHFSLGLTGSEIGAGGGILSALSAGFSLDAGLLACMGTFGRASYRGEVHDDPTLNVHNTNTVRLKLGFQLTPSRRSGSS
jgi:hypothetical protein